MWWLIGFIPVLFCLYCAFDNSPRSWSGYPPPNNVRKEEDREDS